MVRSARSPSLFFIFFFRAYKTNISNSEDSGWNKSPFPALERLGDHSPLYRSGGTPSRHTDRQSHSAWESWPDWLTQNERLQCVIEVAATSFHTRFESKNVTARDFYWLWQPDMLCFCSHFKPWKNQNLFCTGVRTWQKYFVSMYILCVKCVCSACAI